MAAGQGVEEYIELTDFSAGIATGWLSSNHPDQQDGVAQITDTYGCIASARGGLEPGPRLDQGFTAAFHQNNTTPSGYPSQVRVLDMMAAPAWKQSTWWNTTETALPPDGLLFITEHFQSFSGTTYRKIGGWTVDNVGTLAGPVFNSNYASADTINSQVKQWSTGSVALFRTAIGLSTAVDPTEPGVSFSAWHSNMTNTTGQVWDNAETDVSNDFTSSSTWYGGSPYTMTSGWFNTTRMFTHQGRVCWSSLVTPPSPALQGYGDVWNTSAAAPFATFSDDLIVFHDKNAAQKFDASFNYLQIDSRIPDMCGAIASMNQSDLFIVKAQRGGVIIRGDLLQPTVTIVPGVVPTGPYPHTPVVTPLGMVYGTPFGIFAWNGGDVSQNISPLLEGAQWLIAGTHEPTVRSPLTSVGKFSYKYPFIYAPNNWIMDVRTNGWFRSYQPADQGGISFGHWTAGTTNRVYGAPLEIPRTGTYANYAYASFLNDRGATSWSWRSQPLVRTRNRYLKFREVNVVLQGVGTVAVTLIGLGGTTSTVTFTVNSTRPTVLSEPISLEGTDVEVKIVATGSGVNDAPTLRRMSLGYQTTRSV
jgi:hypothetical protein